MAWFQRDHTRRDLRRCERDFVAALAARLSELAAPQIDENETALIAEGNSCLIVLIPHRALGGVSIAVWVSSGRAEVTWAQVAALDCCHDSLDLAVSVGQFGFKPWRREFGPVLDCVAEQINQPLTLRCFGNDRATVLVRDRAGKLCEVGDIGNTRWWSDLLRHAVPTHETVIRFADSEPPPVTEPSGVDRWWASGGRDAWRPREAPLRRLDPLLARFARTHGVSVGRNYQGAHERSLKWGAPIRRLIQVYLEDPDALTWNVWLCASEDRGGARYWKHEFLKRAVSIEEIERGLPQLLEEARLLVESWSSDQLEFATKLSMPVTGTWPWSLLRRK